MELHVGVDDTDSKRGMCSTYVVAEIISELNLSEELIELPELIRLNPTIPWKTRGNGALCFRLDLDDGRVDEIKNGIVEVVDRYRESSSNSGVVFFERDPREIDVISDFSKKAVKEIVNVGKAKKLASEYGIKKEWGSGQGVVGAVCAAGYVFSDYTYELIGYREREKWGTERYLDKNSVKEVSKNKYPLIWDTFDWENDEMVLSPNTPCPVLFGVRGDSLEKIREAVEEIKGEKVILRQLFKTNQGTDEHLISKDFVKNIDPYTSVILDGKVSESPRTIRGGHVIFELEDESGDKVDCAAYEPTKGFRDVVKELVFGDKVKVMGGVRKKPLTINLEKIEVLDLAEDFETKNPVCPSCGNRMESAGKDQGFRCRDCGTKSSDKVKVVYDRSLEKKIYEVPPTARRHLSKPLIREEQN